ncbi:alpha/beta-type small acid-soluble spore protein [Paenibacillus sp. P25]|nr:alpha/beta-type small acid-soluble spore protein [Paenibacillus sp. P25]
MAAGQSRSSNILVVPQARGALEQLKYEVAQELGIQIPQDGYYGYMATRDTGAIGDTSHAVLFKLPSSNCPAAVSDKPTVRGDR